MSNIYEYATAPTGTIHLLDQDAANAATAAGRRQFTLCGRPVLHDWSNGDETSSGIAATCRTCRKGGSPLTS